MNDVGETKSRILDAAEMLFAEHGFDATSLRAITGVAGVNLAAVNYHFGSKEGLIQAVFARRIEPLNAERLARLADAERAHAGAPPLAAVVEAFVAPLIERVDHRDAGGDRFCRLFGRTLTEPGEWLDTLFDTQFRALAERFLAAFGRCLPDLPRAELAWRLHFAIGAMAHTLADRHKLRLLGASDEGPGGALPRLVGFIAAGLAGPPAVDR